METQTRLRGGNGDGAHGAYRLREALRRARQPVRKPLPSAPARGAVRGASGWR